MRFHFSSVDISFTAAKTALSAFLIISLNFKQISVNRFNLLLSILSATTMFSNNWFRSLTARTIFLSVEISVFSSEASFSICSFRKFCAYAAFRNFQFLVLTVTATFLATLWSKRMFMTLFSRVLLFSLIDIAASFEISRASHWSFLSSSI